jgi:hypothetical protein
MIPDLAGLIKKPAFTGFQWIDGTSKNAKRIQTA